MVHIYAIGQFETFAGFISDIGTDFENHAVLANAGKQIVDGVGRIV